MTAIVNLPVTQIVPGTNDRQDFAAAKLAELATSIAEHGLAQPITVRPRWFRCPVCDFLFDAPATCRAHAQPIATQQVYQIVAGERRFRAIRDVLKLSAAPCIVREDLDDEAASAIMLAENTSRANLNPIEEANAYQARIERFGWTPEHVAEVAGVSPATVMQRQALLELIPDAQTLVAHGHLPIGHAAALAGLDNYRQIIALRVYRESKRILPLADFRAITCELRDEQDQAALFDLESYFVELAQRVSEETFRSGKKATPRVPTRSDLPPVPVQKRNTGEVLDAFIKSLLEAGRTAEAAVVGTLYTCLVHGNFVTMPANPLCI